MATATGEEEPYLEPDPSAIYSKAELLQLQEKAKEFAEANGKQRVMKFSLSRCKPAGYFDAIIHESAGIEKPYEKDLNGHQKAPLNGRAKGLFFSPGESDRSPFGDIHYSTSVGKLFNDKDFELFFADFYCPKHEKNAKSIHHITLVIARIGSELQRFCQKYLNQLDWASNPFLRLTYSGSAIEVFEKHGALYTELYYSDSINLNLPEMHRAKIETVGKGSSLPNGEPANERCEQCSLRTVTLADFMSPSPQRRRRRGGGGAHSVAIENS